MSHHGGGFEAEKWRDVSRIYRRAMGMALGRKSGRIETQRRSQTAAIVTKNGGDVRKQGQRDGASGPRDVSDAAASGALFHGRGGDREQNVCERGVCSGSGPFRDEAQGRSTPIARQCHACCRSAVEPPGSEAAGVNVFLRRADGRVACAKFEKVAVSDLP